MKGTVSAVSVYCAQCQFSVCTECLDDLQQLPKYAISKTVQNTLSHKCLIIQCKKWVSYTNRMDYFEFVRTGDAAKDIRRWNGKTRSV